jgi:hypothetical protein
VSETSGQGAVPLPEPAAVLRAIDAYLRHAYGGANPSAAVKSRVEALRGVATEDFFKSPSFERDPNVNDPAATPSRLAVRLGNRFYPHMKLSIDRRPDGRGYLFRADTHDRHIQPQPQSKEYAAFCELMENNQKLAAAVEAAWAEEGLPTFKTFLRDDLARRAKDRG